MKGSQALDQTDPGNGRRAREVRIVWIRWMTLVMVAVLVGGATAAAASDLCFLDDLGLPPLVVKNFSSPKPGQCAGFIGSFQGGAFLASGLTCGSEQGDKIGVKAIIESPVVGETVSYSFFVNRATLAGEGALFCTPAECGVVFDIPYRSPGFSIRQVACPPKEAPAP